MANRNQNASKKWDKRSSKNKRNGNRSNKGYNKKTEGQDFKDDIQEGYGSNDPAWYAADTRIMLDAASFPFNRRTGSLIVRDKFPDEAIPGILALKTVPTFGLNEFADSPVRVAAQRLYTTMRVTQSGQKNYDPVDFFVYMAAMGQVYSFIVWAQRLYAYSMTFSQKNEYWPKGFAAAENVSPVGLLDGTQLAQFRYWLNNFINRASAFAVPNTLPYFNKLAFQYRDIYIDNAATLKNQMYMYSPEGFHKFTINSQTSAGELIYAPLPNNATLAQIEAYGDNLLYAIYEQEDAGTMSGDIVKTWGNNVVKLAQVPEVIDIQPIYDPLVLQQIKNTRVVSTLDPQSTNLIQSSGILYSIPKLTGQTTLNESVDLNRITSDLLLTVDSAEPTAAEVMELTRNIPVQATADTAGTAHIQCGTFVVHMLRFVTHDPAHNTFTVTTSLAWIGGTYSVSASATLIRMLKEFHYAPTFTICDGTGNLEKDIIDTDNWTIIRHYDLVPVHETAWLNMLAVPTIGLVRK